MARWLRDHLKWFTINTDLDAPTNFNLFAKIGKASEWFEYDNEEHIDANYQRFVAEFLAMQEAGAAEE